MARSFPTGETKGRPTLVVAPDDATEGTTPADDLDALLRQSLRVAVGAIVSAAAIGTQIVRRTLGEEPHAGDELAEPPLAALVAGATLGLAVETAALATAAATRTVRTLAPWGSWVFAATGAQPAIRRSLTQLDARWQEVAPETQRAAEAFARELVPEIVDAVLDRIDLTALVEERVDVQALVGRVDLDAVAAGIDVDAVAARLDLDAVIRRLDLAEIARQVIDELDLAAIARSVIDELDLVALIRESTESVTGEVVDDLRYGAVDADRSIARVVDRILRRKRDGGPTSTEDEGATQ
ncbi:MAG TPA: hypothetical protein VFT27_09710 [Actinomycetota bacterium]|nr:hypothetical protein [Actinomycetota bacterium]